MISAFSERIAIVRKEYQFPEGLFQWYCMSNCRLLPLEVLLWLISALEMGGSCEEKFYRQIPCRAQMIGAFNERIAIVREE